MFSDGGELEVPIRAQSDGVLPISIISKPMVSQLQVSSGPCQQMTVKDSKHNSYSPTAKVELRWHRKGSPKSHPEVFYVVEAKIPLVILGRNAFPQVNQSTGSEIHAIGLQPQTAGMA